jgi:hypothetical protein
MYSSMNNTDACCKLCDAFLGCHAWQLSIDATQCILKNDSSYQTAGANCTSGTTWDALPHFTCPINHSTWNCKQDEIRQTLNGIDGDFCSPQCSKVGHFCPSDLPGGVAAKSQCTIHDPVGGGMHCGLNCSTDAECGPQKKCINYYGASICICPQPPIPSVPTPPQPSPPPTPHYTRPPPPTPVFPLPSPPPSPSLPPTRYVGPSTVCQRVSSVCLTGGDLQVFQVRILRSLTLAV